MPHTMRSLPTHGESPSKNILDKKISEYMRHVAGDFDRQEVIEVLKPDHDHLHYYHKAIRDQGDETEHEANGIMDFPYYLPESHNLCPRCLKEEMDFHVFGEWD